MFFEYPSYVIKYCNLSAKVNLGGNGHSLLLIMSDLLLMIDSFEPILLRKQAERR